MERSNVHTHTTYCDGQSSPEEMILGAIEKNLNLLGFSGHGHTNYADYEMTVEGTAKYKQEIKHLKSKYADRISILCGVEQDYLSDLPTDDYDYIIGSTHSITAGGGECIVDWSRDVQLEAVNAFFGGDIYSYIEAYYERSADIARKTGADIVGHFDLVTKFNEGFVLFDENHSRYKTAAIESLKEVLKTCDVFEVNTGAMYKYGKTNPYPAPFLLKEIHERGGHVILTSDSHDVASLGFKFDEMAELLRHRGFKYRKALSSKGFIDIKL